MTSRVITPQLRQHVRQIAMQCAERQVQLWGYTPPLALDRLARDFHADVIESPLPPILQGYSWTRQGRLVVVVNTRQTPMSRRFTLVHEFMHGWLHPRPKTGTLPLLAHADPEDLMEIEANGAAAAFLVPVCWLQPRLEAWDASHGSMRPWNSATLQAWLAAEATGWAREAQVSREMLGYRLLDLGWLDPVAAAEWRTNGQHRPG